MVNRRVCILIYIMKVCNRFFAIDGPNGVGKSTIVESLKQHFDRKRIDCLFTKEPTTSELGSFIITNQNVYKAHTLAALVAADRYDHIEKVISPNLNAGKMVISDRYFASSLVYQVQDGLTYEFIDNLNSAIILPVLYFILTADVETILNRLKSRNRLTRFESYGLCRQEVELFDKAVAILKHKGVMVQVVSNQFSSIDETAERIFDEIMQSQ